MADSLDTRNPSSSHDAVVALIAEAHAAGVGFHRQPDGSLSLITVEDMAFEPETTEAHRAFRVKWQDATRGLRFADVAQRII